MKKFKVILSFLCLVITLLLLTPISSKAKGTTYKELIDVYFAKENCQVYAEPTYTSMKLMTIPINSPVAVVGYYTNGWYRINLGYICYVKMDSLSCSGEFGVVADDDVMGKEAAKVAKDLGYKFHYITMNKQKLIDKAVFNRYIAEKCILYTRINDHFGVYFKMIYDNPVTSDVLLNYTESVTENTDGSRTIYYIAPQEMVLKGTICNFIYKVGYDKIVDNYIKSIDTDEYNLMNSFYTEFSEVSFAPVTQIGDMFIFERETMRSLTEAKRIKMNDYRRGIKYQEYDEKDYISSIKSKLRKDTEYIDYILK